MKLSKDRIIEIFEMDINDYDYKESQNELLEYLKSANSVEKLNYKVISMNYKSGDLNLRDGVNCDKCKNKGVIYYLDETLDEIMVKDCSCYLERNIKNELRKSGLLKSFKEKTFDNFIVKNSYQKTIKNKALEYVNNHTDEWFTILGQSGIGKTHLCTAIAEKLILQGKQFKYFSFATEIKKIISGLRNFDLEVSKTALNLFDSYKEAEVLYIDDFLKFNTKEYIFELIDYRYKNNLITIISSELTFDELYEYDEAVASRIFEKSKGYAISFKNDSDKNYRFMENNNE